MAIRRGQSGAVKYVDEVLAELTRQTPDAVTGGEVSAVHRGRVATRRMGAALEVLGDLVEPHQRQYMRKSLRQIRKSVQDLRDLDVMAEHLEDWQKKGGHASAVERMRAVLAEERRRKQLKVAEGAKVPKWLARAGYWLAVRGGLLQQNQQIAELIRQSLLEQYAVFAAEADRLAEGLLSREKQPGQPQEESSEEVAGQAIEPHALRISGKALRYTFEMAQRQGLGVSVKTLRRFKRLQDALGLWHDYHVLSTRVLQQAMEEMTNGAYRGDEDELILLAGEILGQSHVELRQFAGLWQKHSEPLAGDVARLVDGVVDAVAQAEQVRNDANDGRITEV